MERTVNGMDTTPLGVPECHVCRNELDEPRTLHCGHTYCAHCVDRLVEGGGELPCPTCRAVTVLPDGGLPINFQLADIVKALQEANDKEPATLPGFTYEVFVKPISGTTVPIAVQSNWTVQSFMEEIKRKTGNPIERCYLRTGPTKVLSSNDKHKNMADANLHKGSRVEVMARCLGGAHN